MSVSHRYRNFGGAGKSDAAESGNTSEAREDEKLQAFEAGYQAGWDDAIKAQSTDKEKLSEELAQNLQQMSFTYHEALAKLTTSFEPVFRKIVEKLLPAMLSNSLGSHIVDLVTNVLNGSSDEAVEIVIHSQNSIAVSSLLEGSLKHPFSLVEDDSLGEGQAFVRLGEEERQIDIDGVLAEVSKAMIAFFHETKNAQEANHGQS